MKLKGTLVSLVLGIFCFAVAVSAQTVVVAPSNAASLGFSTADTRPGGAVNFALDGSLVGGGIGSLNITTTSSTAAKAQYLRADSMPLANLLDVSYFSKKNGGSAIANAGFNIVTCLDGLTSPVTPANPLGCTGFTTLVFEPYQSNGTCCTSIPTGVWQQWDVDAGAHWSSRTYSNGTCSVAAGFGGPPFYSLGGLAANCPAAVVVGYGVNVGSNNPSYDISVDLMTINGTTYDFEPYLVATNKDQCKNGGWQTYRRADGSTFRNQGDCVSYVNTGR